MENASYRAPVIRLDVLDRNLLAQLDRDPGASYSDLAVQLGVDARSVSRRLSRLERGGVIRIVGRTLPGFGGRLARITRVFSPPEVSSQLAQRLAVQPNTSWVRLSRDRTEFICGTVEAAGTTQNVVLDLVFRHPGATRVVVHELLRVWGAQDAVTTVPRELDPVDHAILGELAENGRVGSREVGHRLGLDPSTVSRRRRRLMEEGILYLEADIHPAALSGAGDVMVWLNVLPGSVRELGTQLRQLPQSRFVAATSGPTTLVAHLVIPEGLTVVDMIDTQLAHPGITSMEIVPMGQVLKRSNARYTPRPG